MYNAVPPPASVAFKASDDATTNTIQLPASTPKTKITLKSTTLKQKLAYTKLQELKNKRDKICKSLKMEEKKEQKNFWKKRNLFMNKLLCDFPNNADVQSLATPRSLAAESDQQKNNKNDKNTINNNKDDLNKKEMMELRQYIGSNKHLSDETTEMKNIFQYETEKKIEEAIRRGDHELALQLSDDLARKNQEDEIKEALERKRYADYLRKEQEKATKKKGPRLLWGFENKERWECKGNM
jgi:membrane-bound lytic murein transglycosylase